MDAFDADVLIYAATPAHPIGQRVSALFPAAAPGPDEPAIGVGSVLLLPETLAKPQRNQATGALAALARLLARLDLRPVDTATAELATAYAAAYRLRAIDAAHLATAVRAGADRFLTNNTKDFRKESIVEIEITYPADLPEPT